MEADITTQVVGLTSNTDFSIVKLFIRADFIVKSVIVILVLASIFSWALIIDKYRTFKKINLSTAAFEEKFWKAKSAESFYNNLSSNSDDPLTNIFRSGMNELLKTKSRSSNRERVTRILEISSPRCIFTACLTGSLTAPAYEAREWTIACLIHQTA